MFPAMAFSTPRRLTRSLASRQILFPRLSTLGNMSTTSSPSTSQQVPVEPAIIPEPIVEVSTTEPAIPQPTNRESDWVCGICLEDATADSLIDLHVCGRHSFHCSCMYDERNTDERCPICRQRDFNNENDSDDDVASIRSSPESPEPIPSGRDILPVPASVQHFMRHPLVSTSQAVPYAIIYPQITRTSANVRSICTHCRQDILVAERHSRILGCNHDIHNGCLLDIMQAHGLRPRGFVQCTLCDRS